MAVLKIVTGVNDKILRLQSKPVKKIDKQVKKLIVDMIDTLKAADGLGIAAPQVGINLRIFIARLNYDTPHEMMVPMINAELFDLSEETDGHEEGCLSMPNKFGEVKRYKSLSVRYTDIHGKENVLNLTGLNARIMQHETDHLNGILIADKMEREIDVEVVKQDKK